MCAHDITHSLPHLFLSATPPQPNSMPKSFHLKRIDHPSCILDTNHIQFLSSYGKAASDPKGNSQESSSKVVITTAVTLRCKWYTGLLLQVCYLPFDINSVEPA